MNPEQIESAHMKSNHPDCMKCGAPIFQGVLCADCHSGIDTEPAQNQPTVTEEHLKLFDAIRQTVWLNATQGAQLIANSQAYAVEVATKAINKDLGYVRVSLQLGDKPIEESVDAFMRVFYQRTEEMFAHQKDSRDWEKLHREALRLIAGHIESEKALAAKLALAERDSKEVRAAYKRLHSQIGGYLHGEQWDHWQAYNEPRYAPDAAMQPEGGK